MYQLVVALGFLGLMILHRRHTLRLRCIIRGIEAMSEQQEQLNQKLEQISTTVNNVAGDVQTLKTQLEQINQNPQVDLTESIALADEILSRLTTLDESTPAAAEEPTDDELLGDDEDPEA